MNLQFTEEQEAIQGMTRAMLEEYCAVDTVRTIENDPKGYPEVLWKQMSEAGLIGALIPEAYGGGGLSILDATLIYEELGRAMAPIPHFVSGVISAGLLLHAGTEEQKQEWLPKIASGDSILTPAWIEPDRGYGLAGVQLDAKESGDELVLSGTKMSVNYASAAERLIVLSRNGTGVDLLLVDPNAKGITLTHYLSQSGDPHYRVEFENVVVPTSARIGAAGSGWESFNKVMHEAIILLAAQAIGGSARCLEETVEYSKVRIQFDKPLGAFQALAHYMADASTRIDGGRVLVHEAAWNAAEGRSIARLAPMAKLFACNTYQQSTRMCAQIWGGVAFTIEYDVQMFFRRAKEMQLSWWDRPYLEELIAADVLDD